MGRDELTDAVADAHRRGWARVLATVVRVTRDLDAAEDAVQEAFAAAVELWPVQGVPDDTTAWLTTVARNRALDARRRERTLARKLPLLIVPGEDAPMDIEPIEDERLRLVFTCCHPALSLPARVALTLRLVCGVPTPDVARLFLVSQPTMAARLTRAKKKIQAAGIPYKVPAAHELPDRLPAVLAVVSLLLTEGHTASRGESLGRPELVRTATELAEVLADLMPDEAEVLGLLATVRLAAARSAARLDGGGLVLLADQDRSAWDRGLIEQGCELAARAMRRSMPGRAGPYALHAAIAAVHSEAPTYEATDWAQIVALYDLLLATAPSPVTELARAAARSHVTGPAAALDEVTALAADPRLGEYYGVPALRADLLRRLGRNAEAAASYEEAAALTANEVERSYLLTQAAELGGRGCRQG
ncbi:sigma-70 family RNA polymerase sigma factor [Jiangella aurantiaca]|uniref:Sigma-70 family RNA polymerase sigma factor n=1 Tax=Jiangella aurantiaca TaxID=2530373 RepID=A0A4R5A406_9ACTN|nr:sigma-70 family RNA polymerase sigma factor [Jiangella aurantiaca]TDD65780.1 sigma-70 family RNA polymerase sigma factor [Jiangella aurantiaca]